MSLTHSRAEISDCRPSRVQGIQNFCTYGIGIVVSAVLAYFTTSIWRPTQESFERRKMKKLWLPARPRRLARVMFSPLRMLRGQFRCISVRCRIYELPQNMVIAPGRQGLDGRGDHRIHGLDKVLHESDPMSCVAFSDIPQRDFLSLCFSD